ncbi:MAG TPA: thiamine diphosphokinase [Lachnospiraceae bacterium]|nr:thiamine diphosphokinase [Lachnospiraceae bacterium]
MTAPEKGAYTGKRCVIVGGAPIGDYDRVRAFLSGNDYYIYCDCGLVHEKELGRQPDLIVGDFDSFERPERDIETIVLPREKDDTDTVYAAKEAVRRGFEDFLLIGMTGGRFDHSFANTGLLLMLDGLHKTALLVDDHSEMEIVSESPCEVNDSFPFFSLLAVDGPAEGVTVTGARYGIEDYRLSADMACLGVSNEVLKGETARIRVTGGRLLLVRVYRG